MEKVTFLKKKFFVQTNLLSAKNNFTRTKLTTSSQLIVSANGVMLTDHTDSFESLFLHCFRKARKSIFAMLKKIQFQHTLFFFALTGPLFPHATRHIKKLRSVLRNPNREI